MKRGKEIIFVLIFCVIIGTPYFSWIFLKEEFSTDNNENRAIAEFPEISLSEIESFPSEFEAFINDNLPYRDKMIEFVNYNIKYKLFGSSSNESVIVGKDGWLFYNGVGDGDPIKSYQGRDLFTEAELVQIAENLLITKKNLEKDEIEFVLFIAPNKERIYYENMPSYYGEPAQDYAVKQVVDYLEKNTDIRVVYPYDELIGAKEKTPDKPIYYKMDTHWNDYGAYVGTAALLNELGIEMEPYDSEKVSIKSRVAVKHDLADMLNIGDKVDTGSEYYVDDGVEDEFVEKKYDFFSEYIYSNGGQDPRKIFIKRDSFCSSMAPIIASEFNDSYMVHSNYYTNEMVKTGKPDIFVLETTERFLRQLLGFRYE